ncbi:MAG: CRISPR-associated endonuclease Cas1 [Armatimonadota bacterium]|nr:CRISPR-associated endonuclease Cas1 [Armatimonadota bacterium]
MAETTELIPTSMVRKYAYCPRLFYLEFVCREWSDTVDTVQGELVHRRVDEESGSFPAAENLAPEERFAARSVFLSAPQLGLSARIDLLEGSDGTVRPVDYKKGTPGPLGPRDPEILQLCAQGLVLRENGYRCDGGVLYYAGTRRRVDVAFDDELVSRTVEVVGDMQRTAVSPVPPPALVDSPKCPRCSLVGICLPDETAYLRGEKLEEVRRLVPARDDTVPLYVLEQGAVVGRLGERITVRTRGGEDAVSVRLLDVSQVSAYGNVQVTAQAVRALAERGVPIFHHTYNGWLVAVTSGVLEHNAPLRVEQYRVADDPQRSLPIARAIVAGKLQNQRTLLRRNHPDCPPAALRELARLAKAAKQAADPDRLFGIEGLGARVYFSQFAGMLKDPMGFDAAGRDRRPPPDPVNAVLSFLYALLLKDALRALLAVGLDPFRGVYHRMRPGRPSLALDLMEEFRPIVADSVALWLVNNRVLSPEDFVRRGPACALKDGARRRVIEGYEARMDTLVRHPLFGYQASYRRVVEVQARLLARAIAGEIPVYRPFTTR